MQGELQNNNLRQFKFDNAWAKHKHELCHSLEIVQNIFLSQHRLGHPCDQWHQEFIIVTRGAEQWLHQWPSVIIPALPAQISSFSLSNIIQATVDIFILTDSSNIIFILNEPWLPLLLHVTLTLQLLHMLQPFPYIKQKHLEEIKCLYVKITLLQLFIFHIYGCKYDADDFNRTTYGLHG